MENSLQIHMTNIFSIYRMVDKRLVIIVAPQKDIWPQKSTYPKKLVINNRRIETPEIQVWVKLKEL